MSEFPRSGHERELIPRPVTGLFRLNVRGVPLEFSHDGKALPASGEPRFAIKDVLVLHTTAGWSEFSKKLVGYLDGVEKELHQDFDVYSTAESPIEELTEGMSSGEIRLVTPEEYNTAYLNKYGNVIQGPFIW